MMYWLKCAVGTLGILGFMTGVLYLFGMAGIIILVIATIWLANKVGPDY